MKKFRALGISYRNASLEVREAIALDEGGARTILRKAQEMFDISELLIVSTCNRTELYYFSDTDLSAELIHLIRVQRTLDADPSDLFVRWEEQDAVRHLYEVALGVDSMILGDIQITSQVKMSYQWSTEEGLAGPFLHRLMHSIFYTNKRVVQETELRDGTASVASVATDVTKHFIKSYQNPRITVIGLGDMGRTVAENLKEFPAEVTLINRTASKAEELGLKLGYQTAPLESLKEVVGQSQVVISAVQVEKPVLHATDFTQNIAPKLLIDLGVPRSIEDAVELVPGILLYNIDQLNEKATSTIEKRRKAISKVQVIIQESLEEFMNWSQEMEVSPTIQKLKKALDDIRKEELSRYVGKLSDKEAKVLEQATKAMIQKVIKLPVLQLKAACKRGEADTLVDVLHDLFNLEKEAQKK